MKLKELLEDKKISEELEKEITTFLENQITKMKETLAKEKKKGDAQTKLNITKSITRDNITKTLVDSVYDFLTRKNNIPAKDKLFFQRDMRPTIKKLVNDNIADFKE